jgi:hypothetical protein
MPASNISTHPTTLGVPLINLAPWAGACAVSSGRARCRAFGGTQFDARETLGGALPY